jgi:hypothetical protein
MQRTIAIYAVTGLAAAVAAIGIIVQCSSSPPKKAEAVTITPDVIYPAPGDTVSADSVSFVWNVAASASGYAIHLSTTTNFTDTFGFRAGLTDTTCRFTGRWRTGPLYWRVGATAADTTIVWGPPRMMHVKFLPPAVPTLLSPSHRKTRCKPSPGFSWKKVPGAETYRLQIALDTGFTRCVFDSSADWPDTVTVGPLVVAQSYYWRVSALKREVASDWSSVYKFSIADTAHATNDVPVDFGSMVVTALQKGDLSGAETAMASMDRNDLRIDTLRCRLAGMYIYTGKNRNADLHLQAMTTRDMYADVLRGKLLLARKDYDGACKMFEQAMQAKTLFNHRMVHSDACYFRAIAAQRRYDAHKNDTTRNAAMDAWEEVWNLYKNNPGHDRYKEAAQKNSSITGEE